MILEELVEMALESHYKCSVWNTESEEIMFTGELSALPDAILQMNVVTWELLEDSVIQFNVE